MAIPEKISEIKPLFEKHDAWEDRYKELISFGKNLPAMNQEHQIDKYLVKGCQSLVWLYPELKDGKVFFEADSDALIVKGIVAILVKVYSGETPKDILEHSPDFLKEMGLSQHLSMNRSNGLTAIVKTIKLYATAYQSMLEVQK